MEMPDVQVLVQSVANKQQQNKRKRDPDMYLDAVLECTVRKLNRERMERDEVLRKRRRTELVSDRTASYCASTDSSLLENSTTDECSRTSLNDSTLSTNIDCNLDTNFANLDEELSGELKDLIDELSQEFPCEFWLTDSNNNNNNNTPAEANDSEGDKLFSSFIEVLCST